MKTGKKFLLMLLTLTLLLTLPIGGIGTYAEPADNAGSRGLTAADGNLAYGKDVYSVWTHHEAAGFVYTNLTDGSPDTGWHSGDAPTNRRTWAAVDLGKTMTFDTVDIYSMPGGFPNGLRIVVTDDESLFANAADPGKMNPLMPEGEIVFELYDYPEKDAAPYVCQFEKTSGRYVIVYGMSLNHQWYSMALAEIAVYDTGYTPKPSSNLALGVEAVSDSSHEDSSWNWGLKHINDGDRYNMFVADNTNDHGFFAGYHSHTGTPHDGSADVTITFPLAALSRVKQVVIYPCSLKWTTPGQSGQAEDTIYLPSSFAVEVSDNGEDWKEVFAKDNFVPDGYAPISCDFEETNASFVRVVFKAITAHIKLSEIEIYGADSKEPDEPGELSCGDSLFALYRQERTGENGTHDMRVVIVTNYKKLLAANTTYTVRVTFVLQSDAEKSYTRKLGGADSQYSLFQKVTAKGDEYVAAEGYALFGNQVTGIPDGAYKEVVVTVTDNATGNVVFTGRG